MYLDVLHNTEDDEDIENEDVMNRVDIGQYVSDKDLHALDDPRYLILFCFLIGYDVFSSVSSLVIVLSQGVSIQERQCHVQGQESKTKSSEECCREEYDSR